MPNDLIQKEYLEEETERKVLPPDDWQIAFVSLSVQVQEWLCSPEAANNNREIAKKFNLPPTKNPLLAYLTGQAILKKIPVDSLTYALRRDLEVDELTARQITLEVVYRQFLPIVSHFPKLKDFIEQLGGEVPEKLLKTETPEPKPSIVLQKTVSPTANQNLSAKPSKITKKS